MSGQRERLWITKSPRGRLGLSSGALLLAVPFLAVGAWVGGIGLGVFPQEPGTRGLPPRLVTLVGMIFFGAGLYLAGATLRSVLWRSLAVRGRGPAPWRFDHAWSHRGVYDETGKAILRNLMGVAALGVFLVALHAFLFMPGGPANPPWGAYAVLAIFDLVAVAIMINALRLTLRRMRFGRTRVRFNAFPFYLGGSLDVVFEGGPGLADVRGLNVALRCIEEAIETTGRGKDRSTRLSCYRIYHDTRGADADRAGRLALSFPLPADLPGNRLLDTPPTYWELAIQAALPGVDYEGVFLMPVYPPRAQ